VVEKPEKYPNDIEGLDALIADCDRKIRIISPLPIDGVAGSVKWHYTAAEEADWRTLDEIKKRASGIRTVLQIEQAKELTRARKEAEKLSARGRLIEIVQELQTLDVAGLLESETLPAEVKAAAPGLLGKLATLFKRGR
jgi:uncharacterized pyridoxal phosphate-containing UPF0001 family protein